MTGIAFDLLIVAGFAVLCLGVVTFLGKRAAAKRRASDDPPF